MPRPPSGRRAPTSRSGAIVPRALQSRLSLLRDEEKKVQNPESESMVNPWTFRAAAASSTKPKAKLKTRDTAGADRFGGRKAGFRRFGDMAVSLPQAS